MSAMRAEVVGRRKRAELMPAGPYDFILGPGLPTSPDDVLRDPRVSLYCLDPFRRTACFVEVPDEIRACELPFLYQAQFKYATHVVSVPLDRILEWHGASSCWTGGQIFIHSVGRCGSTLVAKALATSPAVCSISEPDVFTQLVGWRGSAVVSDDELRQLAACCVRALCKPMVGKLMSRTWAIKLRSQCSEIADLIVDALPAARHLYMMREPFGWLESVSSSFVDAARENDQDYRLSVESTFARVCPLVRRLRVKGQPMPVWRSWLLHWIANAQSHSRLLDRGYSMLTIDFSTLTRSPEETIGGVFKYCDIPRMEWESVKDCLQRDSQAGSVLARDMIDSSRRGLPEQQRAEALALLKAFDYSESSQRVVSSA